MQQWLLLCLTRWKAHGAEHNCGCCSKVRVCFTLVVLYAI
jgi:hypothetical protein